MPDKYSMTLYPSVWPLPYGISIRTDYEEQHNYAIPRSQTQCWPVKLDDFQQVLITAVHNTYVQNQQNTLRAWLSIDPNGSNVLPAAYGVNLNIHLGLIGNSWCFHIVNIDNAHVLPANVTYIIEQTKQYYFNVQNVENKDNSYYLKFTFAKDGATIDL
jgi:hypothetical protein